MSTTLANHFRLVPRGGAGLCCDDEGLALGAVPLISTADDGGNAQRHYRLCSTNEIADALARAYDLGQVEDLERRIDGFARVFTALEAGDHVRARIAAVQLRLPEIAPAGMAKLARSPSLRKYSPDQPRIPAGSPGGGQWAGGNGELSAAADKNQGDLSNNNGGREPVQVAQNDAGTTSDASSTAASPEDANKYVALNDGTVPKDHLGNPLKKPPNVSLEDNARLGQALAHLDDIPELGINGEYAKAGAMVALFSRKTGTMDYQWIYRVGDKYNKDYIDFGNYNYGVVAAAAGYTFDDAMKAAGIVNLFGAGDKSGPWWNNPTNLVMIRQGFEDYKAGKIIPPNDK